MTKASELRERLDGFAYDYRMRCDCGAAVEVSAETYYREQSVEPRVPCRHCDGEVHFGPAVALLRDENDPALGDVTQFAWYHTSTWADWPSADHRAEAEATARQTAVHFRLDAGYMVEQATTKALHLGTYQAAIENMLRRMRNQADGRAQFYLYRVAVRIDPGKINEGYRDENDEVAALLTVADLNEADLDAVRYLNVHEATGTLSLVVRPSCIAATHSIPIPIDDLALTPSADLLARLAEVEVQLERNAQEHAALPTFDQHQLTRTRIGVVPDPDGIAERAQEIELRGYGLWADLENVLSEHYLGDVSPVVAHDFRSAVSAWRRRGDADVVACAERFALLASLLIRQHEVMRLVAERPWRELYSVPFET
jgi:hypothetical protein